MSGVALIGAFAALLAVVFAAAALAGGKVSPEVDEPERHLGSEGDETMTTHGLDQSASEHGGHEAATGASLPGLAVAQDGYRLVPGQETLLSGRPQELEFTIQTEDGSTVQQFDVEHDRRMHLIVVRRDFQGFQHLHPRQLEGGSWSVSIAGLEPGVYRVFADFSTGGKSLTLATDQFVSGQFDPQPIGPVARTADAGEGYEVDIRTFRASGGETVPIEFEVTRNGEPVDGVEPYLGADGHLVALRQGDQAFLHTHPEGKPGGPGPIRFQVSYPTAGKYRLYLQFKHGGEVRTAEFTRLVGGNQHEHGEDGSHG